MLCGVSTAMLANMSQHAEMPSLNWSDLAVSELLPTGTVTLLLGDVEGSTRLWESQPEQMTIALAHLNRTVNEAVAAHDGVRPQEQGEGDSFVTAFARASDAVACALDLQRAPLAPIRLRIGVHTGEIQLRDDANYAGPTINRAARVRDLAHGGQTVLTGAAESMVVDRLPDGVWLTDLGTHALRDLPRSERVVQLCHPDLRTEFPPLRTPKGTGTKRLPVQLTSFIGRAAQLTELLGILADNRLVTLTGTGGAGKTRIAIEIAGHIADDFRDGAWYVDLAPLTHPDMVPVALARSLGLPDQPGASPTDMIVRFVGERQMLVVLDNCEHVLDMTAGLAVELLKACPHVTLLATSREPMGVAGEVNLRVPSLRIADEAIELFAQRARLVRVDFTVTDDNAAFVTEICRRLDGMPLAIELAAARVRALSLPEIVDSLHDRFRLLTGGSRTVVRRQQTLRASVDWSHALLTEPERMLFRRLAVFLGGFDLGAAQAVSSDDVERFQVLDLLTLLVDKSLVVADEIGGRTRYRLLETVRQYAQEKLAESGQADAVRTLHRGHYLATANSVDAPADAGHEERLEQAEAEIDNLRAAFTWSRERGDTESALQLACWLYPLWLARGRNREGYAWLQAALSDLAASDDAAAPAVYARALADKVALDVWAGLSPEVDHAEKSLAIARELDDPGLLARALCARVLAVGYDDELMRPFFTEAIEVARQIDDKWRLAHLYGWRGYAAVVAGDPISARDASEQGLLIADAIGNHFASRTCRAWLAWAHMVGGDPARADAMFDELHTEADEVNDLAWRFTSLHGQIFARAHQGDAAGARDVAQAAVRIAPQLSGFYPGVSYGGSAIANLADANLEACVQASDRATRLLSGQPKPMGNYLYPRAEAALNCGDLTTAQRVADEAVSKTSGWHLAIALRTRARVALVQRDFRRAEHDAHAALGYAADLRACLGIADTFECLARLAVQEESFHEAARLLGAAEAVRRLNGEVRFKVYDADFETAVAAIREALGQEDFDAAWAAGAELSTEEAIAYAQRGRGERKRPASGWGSLTPMEQDVVRLVREGLGNKEIGARLFISPRTVQTHLTHVYAKLGISSRVQLVQEAARSS
jgi:predicted ATPase/class 3 adenylate cyclase/DNA-binding CsgD family transcriptional regulator